MNIEIESESEKKNVISWIQKTYFSKDSLKRRFPISQWLPGYEWNEFKCDLLAGLTLACTLIPQALGFALLANVPITYGLYSSIFTTFVYTLFGSSKDTTIGPTAVQSMFTGYYVSIGNLNYAALLSFISGILQIIFGLLRLDFIVDLIPFPVISAFTNATVITIAVSQLPGFFGVPKSKHRSPNAFLTFYDFLVNLDKLSLKDTILGCFCTLFIFAVKFTADVAQNRKQKQQMERDGSNGVKEKLTAMIETKFFRNLFVALSLARNLITVVICALIAYCLRESEPFRLTSEIEPGLPSFEVPHFSTKGNETSGETFLEVMHNLTPGWFVMPFLASLTAISVPKAMSLSTLNPVPKRILGDKIPLRSFDASQEILTLGIANFLGSFFHAFPGAVSFNRAMILHTSGVKTQMCNVITGIVVLLSMLPIISPAFHYIPITTLSAVVICAVVLLGKPQDFVFMYRTNIVDFVLYMVTFLLTLLAGLVPGILTGIALFILNLLAKIIRPQIECQLKQVTYEENNNHSCYPYLHVRPTQSIHFPSIDYLVSKTIESLPNISTAKSCDTKFVVVIDGKHMFHTDSTFLKGIKDFAVCVQRRGIQIIFHNFQTAIVQKLHSMFKDNKIAFNESQENDDLIKAIQTAYSGTFKV